MLTSLYTPTLKQDTDNYLVQRRNLEALCDVVFGPVPVEMVPNCENILEEGNQHFALEEFIARVVDLINELGTKTYYFSQVYQRTDQKMNTVQVLLKSLMLFYHFYSVSLVISKMIIVNWTFYICEK